ncbi:unnamed protein product [Closterium sp. NIES-54]
MAAQELRWLSFLLTDLALDFFSSSANPSLFVCRGSTPFFVLVYVDDLVFATPDRNALAFVKEELQRRHTCTNLGELQHYLGLQITRDRAARTITLTQSHVIEQILSRFRFPFSKVQLTPLAVDHGLTAPPLDESFESSGPYPELVGCLICEAEVYAAAMAAQELRWLSFLLDTSDCAEAQQPARHPALPTMASLRVLTFDHEGGLIQFDTWLDDLQLYLLSDSRDSVSLFDHTSGASLDPPATADSATRSQWLTRDTAACLAIRNHLPLAECAHFGHHKTAKAQYDAIVARYSSLATAALGRLLLPYLFPQLSAFATVEDLVTHLRTSNAR